MDKKLIHTLSKEQEDLVLAEVGYTREQLKADVLHIRDWLEQQHHLPACKLKENDAFLIWFLTGCKGSLEKAKKKLDNYYTVRAFSEIFKKRDPLAADYLNVRNMISVAVVPQAGFNGVYLAIFNFPKFDLDKYDFLNGIRSVINLTEIFIRLTGVNSRQYFIFDCKSLPPAFITKLIPSVIRDVIFLMEEVFPERFIRISFINAPSYIDTAVNTLFKPFFSKKVKERLQVTSGGFEDLLNYFSPSILPRDYGGDSSNPSLKELNDLWVKYEQDKREWFLNELSERADESKRIVTDKTPKNPYFGVHGSLKKLVID